MCSSDLFVLGASDARTGQEALSRHFPGGAGSPIYVLAAENNLQSVANQLLPAFSWRGVPAEAKQLAVVVSDPDAPLRTFLHWLVTGLPATDGGFAEGAAPAGGRQWTNSGGKQGWYPPCPPFGTHRYFFQVFALDAPVDGNTSKEALRHIDAHTIAWGSLMGTVSR